MLFQNVGICLPMNFGWFGGQCKWILKIWLCPKLGTIKSDDYVIIIIPIRIAMTEGYTPLSDPPRYVYVYMLIHMCEQVPKPRGLMPSFHISLNGKVIVPSPGGGHWKPRLGERTVQLASAYGTVEHFALEAMAHEHRWFIMFYPYRFFYSWFIRIYRFSIVDLFWLFFFWNGDCPVRYVTLPEADDENNTKNKPWHPYDNDSWWSCFPQW